MLTLFKDRIDIHDGTSKAIREHKAGLKILNKAMKALLDVDVSEKDIVYGSYGKPYLRDGFAYEHGKPVQAESRYFNISHAGNYVVCVISDYEVGCDIEKIHKVPENLLPLLEVMREMVMGKTGELEALKRIADYDGDEELTSILCWTLYESYGKCVGCGVPLSEDALRDVGKFQFCSGWFDDAETGDVYVVSGCWEEKEDV